MKMTVERKEGQVYILAMHKINSPIETKDC